jgi:hypothetical protein
MLGFAPPTAGAARREFEFNPDKARVRDEKTVEGYTG